MEHKRRITLAFITFWTIHALVTFVEKNTLPRTGGDIAFLIGELGTCLLSLIIMAIMLYFLPRKTLMGTIILVRIGIVMVLLA
jgi:hypothetical protein